MFGTLRDSKDICEAHSAEAPVSGHVTPDGNFVLDAGCKYEIRNPSQVTACLDGSWLVATGSSNSQLMWNTIVMMLAPGEADVMRPGRFGGRDLMDIVIEQGRIIYINTVRSSEEICRQVARLSCSVLLVLDPCAHSAIYTVPRGIDWNMFRACDSVLVVMCFGCSYQVQLRGDSNFPNQSSSTERHESFQPSMSG